MPRYNPDSPDSIRTVVDNDDQSLSREGFKLPSEVRLYADDTHPRSEAIVPAKQHMSEIAVAAALAWELSGSDELF